MEVMRQVLGSCLCVCVCVCVCMRVCDPALHGQKRWKKDGTYPVSHASRAQAPGCSPSKDRSGADLERGGGGREGAAPTLIKPLHLECLWAQVPAASL